MGQSDVQLLRGLSVHNDEPAGKVLLRRQRTRSQAKLEKNVKKSNIGLLPVFQAAIRCVLALRPNVVLTDCSAQNQTYIGSILLHPDFEIAQVTAAVLVELCTQERFVVCGRICGCWGMYDYIYIYWFAW